VATNKGGRSYGAERPFTTKGLASPIVQPGAPLLVSIPTIVFPKEAAGRTLKSKSLTNAQKLAKALKVCRKRLAAHPSGKRASCEKQAHRKYAKVMKPKPA
jgi:hypothetical protein